MPLSRPRPYTAAARGGGSCSSLEWQRRLARPARETWCPVRSHRSQIRDALKCHPLREMHARVLTLLFASCRARAAAAVFDQAREDRQTDNGANRNGDDCSSAHQGVGYSCLEFLACRVVPLTVATAAVTKATVCIVIAFEVVHTGCDHIRSCHTVIVARHTVAVDNAFDDATTAPLALDVLI